MRSYTFKITKTFHFFGYPQARYQFTIKGGFLEGKITWYGNQGFDALEVTKKHNGRNAYFWEMHALMKEIYGNNAKKIRECFKLREGESAKIEIEY